MMLPLPPIAYRSDDATMLATPAVMRVNQSTFVGITWAMVVISFTFVVFRCYSRLQLSVRLHTDDYLTLAAWVMLLVSAIAWQAMAYLLYWLYDVLAGRRQYDAVFLAKYGPFLHMIAVWSILYYSCVWTVKLAFLMFFRRLGSTVRAHKIWWWVVLAAVVVSWVVCVADLDWMCTVRDTDFMMTRCMYVDQVKYQETTFYINLALDLLTDCLILSIPIAIVWNVQIPLRKKVILFALFSATIIIMIAAILRITLVKGPDSDQNQQISIDWLYLWSNIEAAIAICISCVASFRKLFTNATRTQYGAARNQGRGGGGPLKGSSGASTRGGAGTLTFGGKLGSTFMTTISRGGTRTDRDEYGWTDAERLDSHEGSQGSMVPLKNVHVRTTVAMSSDPNGMIAGTREKVTVEGVSYQLV